MLRAFLRRLLLWNADAIRAEREAYQRVGYVGAEYLRNSLTQELDCRLRADALRPLPPLAGALRRA